MGSVIGRELRSLFFFLIIFFDLSLDLSGQLEVMAWALSYQIGEAALRRWWVLLLFRSMVWARPRI